MTDMHYIFGDILTGAIVMEYDCQGVSTTASLDGNDFRATLHLDITGRDNDTTVSGTIPGHCFCVIERNGQIIGDYIITSRTYQSQAKSMQLYGKGWRSYPYMRIADRDYTYTNTDQIQVFLAMYADLQADPNSAKVILPSYSPSGVLISLETKGSEVKKYGEIFDNFANGDTGFDWDVVTTRNLNTYDRRLVYGYPTLGAKANPAMVIFEYPGNITNYWEAESVGSRGGTHLYAIGGGEGDTTIQATVVHSDLLANGYPRYDVDSSHKDITNLNALVSIATQEALIRKPPVSIITAEVKGDTGIEFGSYSVGDACRLIILDPRHPEPLDKQTRILSWEYYPPASDNVELVRFNFEGDDIGE